MSVILFPNKLTYAWKEVGGCRIRTLSGTISSVYITHHLKPRLERADNYTYILCGVRVGIGAISISYLSADVLKHIHEKWANCICYNYAIRTNF